MIKILPILAVMMFSLSAQAADWQIDNAQSRVSFISTKKVNVSEVHSFGQLSGGLDASGNFLVKIDLSSVDTNIDIRDSRMKEFLFDVVDFPSAQITGNITSEQLNTIKVGQQMRVSVPVKLALHGRQQALTFDVVISKLADDTLFLVSAEPVILNVSDYDLVGGVEKLRELAGLSSISHAVPVSFYLTLTAAN
ncbi:YceI family protein [Methylophaga sp.]|uniref:YceI family protein n=1 Tax=Methylophaga sp. TaxID=2024840 RepID=UPI003F69B3C1